MTMRWSAGPKFDSSDLSAVLHRGAMDSCLSGQVLVQAVPQHLIICLPAAAAPATAAALHALRSSDCPLAWALTMASLDRKRAPIYVGCDISDVSCVIKANNKARKLRSSKFCTNSKVWTFNNSVPWTDLGQIKSVQQGRSNRSRSNSSLTYRQAGPTRKGLVLRTVDQCSLSYSTSVPGSF